MKDWIWSGKPWQAFKNVAILFSFTMNFILLIAVLIGAFYFLPMISEVASPLAAGLNDNLVELGQAHIMRTIRVDDAIPIQFSLPVSDTTSAGIAQLPISQTIPVSLALAVDIPLEETELGQPFYELQALISPLHRFLSNLPGDNGEVARRLVAGLQEMALETLGWASAESAAPAAGVALGGP